MSNKINERIDRFVFILFIGLVVFLFIAVGVIDFMFKRGSN